MTDMSKQLPEEMIVRIFERLPIKSLIRFTCLSKRWRFIILSDQHFSQTQFMIASQHSTLTRSLLFFNADDHSQINFDSEFGYKFESLELGDNSSSFKKVRCPFIQPSGTPRRGRYVRAIGSCNGLVCALFKTSICIWNPSTGFYKKLPDPGPDPSCPQEYQQLSYLENGFGFGYLSSTDDYIVIANSKFFREKEELKIMSLRANAWKKIDRKLRTHGQSILLNETLHWIDNSKDIVTFDLAKEEFGIMPVLPLMKGKSVGASIGRSLCALVVNNSYDDLWVMKEYGVADSWTKKWTFDFATQLGAPIPYSRVILVTETSLYAVIWEPSSSERSFKLIRSVHEEEQVEICMVSKANMKVIEYQQTLLWIP